MQSITTITGGFSPRLPSSPPNARGEHHISLDRRARAPLASGVRKGYSFRLEEKALAVCLSSKKPSDRHVKLTTDGRTTFVVVAGASPKSRGRPCWNDRTIRTKDADGMPVLPKASDRLEGKRTKAFDIERTPTFSGNRRVQTKKPPAPTSIGLGETHTFKTPGVGRPPKKLCWLPAAALYQEADKSIMDIARPPPQRMAPQPGQTCHSKKYCWQACPDSGLTYLIKAGAPRSATRRGVPNCRDAPAIVRLCRRQLLLKGSPVLP
jgi:hypothetical protein